MTSPGDATAREGTIKHSDEKGADNTTMAVSTPQRSYMGQNAGSKKDIPVSALALLHGRSVSKSPYNKGQSRTSLPLHYQRRSLYDLQELGNLTMDDEAHGASHEGDTAENFEVLPSTPQTAINEKGVHFKEQDFTRSTERQQYRSWRSGKAKLEGLTIAQSQRKQSHAELGVDKLIDAQLPQQEPLVNARSRKASHYLGLFKENEAEERRLSEQSKVRGARDSREDSLVDTPKASLLRRETEPQPLSVHDDIEYTEDGMDVTVSAKRKAHNLPLGLLEEIRNHHHLAPNATRNISYPKSVPAHDTHTKAKDDKSPTDEDEESDREHISKATYFPHQGIVLGESPIDDAKPVDKQLPKATRLDDGKQENATEDVQIALRSDSASDWMHGDLSHVESASDVNNQNQPAPPRDRLLSDSEYESSGYSTGGYDSTVSEEGEHTPTATPIEKGSFLRPKRRPSGPVHSHQAPAPIGAVELKPYKHQVGGHTTVFRFSRRAICKQLNSKENMFYETIERNHPELLGYMPR